MRVWWRCSPSSRPVPLRVWGCAAGARGRPEQGGLHRAGDCACAGAVSCALLPLLLGLCSPRPQPRWARGSSIPEPEAGVGDAAGIRWCQGTVCEDKEAAQNGRGAQTPPEAGICCCE